MASWKFCPSSTVLEIFLSMRCPRDKMAPCWVSRDFVSSFPIRVLTIPLRSSSFIVWMLITLRRREPASLISSFVLLRKFCNINTDFMKEKKIRPRLTNHVRLRHPTLLKGSCCMTHHHPLHLFAVTNGKRFRWSSDNFDQAVERNYRGNGCQIHFDEGQVLLPNGRIWLVQIRYVFTDQRWEFARMCEKFFGFYFNPCRFH